MTPAIIALLVTGLFMLVTGAEIFVRGASRLAALIGISPLVVGLTVVAFGTSSPEIAVTVRSSLSGAGDLAVGNVIGSNICNVLLILGISATIAPLVVAQRLVWLDVPVMVGVSVLLLVLGFDGGIGLTDGLLLFAGAIGYTTFLVVQSRREERGKQKMSEAASRSSGTGALGVWALNLALIGGGLALLIVGSNWLVRGAVSIAEFFGISQLVIGLTVVALGTSLPEVATSMIATIRGERDIAVGNVVGSNIFNVLLVLGIAGMISPEGIPVAPAALRFDIPVMIAVAVACLPIFFTGHRINRWEGLLFLGYYFAYTAYLVLASAEHAAVPVFSSIMVGFVLPLTAITLATVGFRAWRSRHPASVSGVTR